MSLAEDCIGMRLAQLEEAGFDSLKLRFESWSAYRCSNLAVSNYQLGLSSWCVLFLLWRGQKKESRVHIRANGLADRMSDCQAAEP